MKVYTKSGDRGTTSLIGGERVSKCDLRVEAYGTVDELAAFIALLGDKMRSDSALAANVAELEAIGSKLMTIESLLAAGENLEFELPQIKPQDIEFLEQRIDAMQAIVPQITKFTIPGGDVMVSLCHVCRTVCRRAERRAIEAAAEHPSIDEIAVKYLNRLSDYIYLLGRLLTHHLKVEEILWIP